MACTKFVRLLFVLIFEFTQNRRNHMAFLARKLHSTIFILRRNHSSIPRTYSSTIPTGKAKARQALSLLKAEKNPEKIIEICRSASLTPRFLLDRIAFSIAISKLKDTNHLEGIRTLLEELKERPDLRNERFMSHSIILYGQAGMFENAIATFEKMDEYGVERTVDSLNSLLLSCRIAEKYDEVGRIFADYPGIYGIKPNIDTYNHLIKALCESGCSSSGYSIIADMDKQGINPNEMTYATLISEFYKEEKFDDVGKALKSMKDHGIQPGLAIYNQRIQSLCKLKRSFEAKALLDGLLSRKTKVDSTTYHHLILGFCDEGNYEEAKKLFQSMKSSGCEPTGNCYFTLIYYLCRGGHYEAALEFYKESMERNWVPYFTLMRSLVNGLASVSKVDEAREIVRQMKDRFQRTESAHLWKEIEESLAK